MHYYLSSLQSMLSVIQNWNYIIKKAKLIGSLSFKAAIIALEKWSSAL
jgi:hypothetical protein